MKKSDWDEFVQFPYLLVLYVKVYVKLMKLPVEFSRGNPKCGPDDIGCTTNKWESGKSLMDSDLVARIKWQQNNKTKKENKMCVMNSDSVAKKS